MIQHEASLLPRRSPLREGRPSCGGPRSVSPSPLRGPSLDTKISFTRTRTRLFPWEPTMTVTVRTAANWPSIPIRRDAEPTRPHMSQSCALPNIRERALLVRRGASGPQFATLDRARRASRNTHLPRETATPTRCADRAGHSGFSLAEPNPRCCSAGPCRPCFTEPVMTLDQLTLSFSVSNDEEYVSLHLISDGSDIDLGERTHNFLLLTLARRRLADTAQGLRETSCGWTYADDLAHDPSMASPRLNIDVLRIRRHLASHGVIGAIAIIERRRSTRQLRIGTARISIATL
jgi:hypothetical protein